MSRFGFPLYTSLTDAFVNSVFDAFGGSSTNNRLMTTWRYLKTRHPHITPAEVEDLIVANPDATIKMLDRTAEIWEHVAAKGRAERKRHAAEQRRRRYPPPPGAIPVPAPLNPRSRIATSPPPAPVTPATRERRLIPIAEAWPMIVGHTPEEQPATNVATPASTSRMSLASVVGRTTDEPADPVATPSGSRLSAFKALA
jgi:hypothetical protein